MKNQRRENPQKPFGALPAPLAKPLKHKEADGPDDTCAHVSDRGSRYKSKFCPNCGKGLSNSARSQKAKKK